MSKPISQLDDLVNLSQFIVPGIEGPSLGPYTNSKGKLVSFFVPKTGGNFTGPISVNGTPLIPEAPSDGAQYARKNAAWSPVVIPPTDWASIPGKPSTFPPTLPIPAAGISGSISDAQHGNLSGGALHALASGATPGFMAAGDKSKLDGIAAGATVGIPEAPTDGQQYARKSSAWAVVAQPPPATSIGDNPPASPVHGQQWWKSDTGNMFIYYNDGNTSQWVQVNIPAQMLADYVPVAGGTMTGNLTVSKGMPALILNRPDATTSSIIYGQKAGSPRWDIKLGASDAESGSNAGSSFSIDAYDDSGTYINTPLMINRATALTQLTGDLTIIKAGPQLNLNKAASGQTNLITGMTGGKYRWALVMGDSAAESTGDQGSGFYINRHKDDGTYKDSVFGVLRNYDLIDFYKGQLRFPGTQNPINDANTLDDYREGTWVPVLSGSGSTFGYTFRTGTYTKIGRKVTAFFSIKLATSGNTLGTSGVNIQGFPYANGPSVSLEPPISWWNSGIALYNMNVQLGAGSSQAAILGMNSLVNTNMNALTAQQAFNATAGTQLDGSITYEVS